MNGVSLWVVLAVVGVDAGWEIGPGGRQIYTIRIEPQLLEALGKGQSVASDVSASDRGLRSFQIVVSPKSPSASGTRSEPAANRAADESMVQHGWRPCENGGLEYLLLITPERLLTLANGVPIVGEVHSEVPEIRRFLIYVGAGGRPPREGLPLSSRQETPSSLTVNDRQAWSSTSPARPAPQRPDGLMAAPDLPWSGGGVRPFQYGDSSWRTDINAASAPPSAQAADPRAGYAPSPNDPRWSQFAWNDPRAGGALPARDDRVVPYGYAPQPGGLPSQSPATAAPVAAYAQRPVSPAPGGNEPVAASAATPSAASPANGQPAAGSQPPASNWNQAVMPSGAGLDGGVRPWTPLILTTLALFASVGANAYLGWLAWSFFWRYRDTANDLARARSLASANRQAA